MGGCHAKFTDTLPHNSLAPQPRDGHTSPRENPGPLPKIEAHHGPGTEKRSKLSPYSPAPVYRDSPATTSGKSTPLHRRKLPFPPPSPAKHIKALLRRRVSLKPNGATIPENDEDEPKLDKSFGYPRNFRGRYEIGDEIGRGHFGYTCSAKGKKGEMKGKEVAVKVIPKAEMTTAIGIEDVRREVKILSALSVSRHENLIRFFEAFEDEENVYIVMEICKGGELLDMIISRGGKYSEEEAKDIIVQILSVVSFCHIQGVVHRDLKPENFLYASKGESSCLKLIDFGLSEFVRPDGKLIDIVGSAYYVAPEVLHRSYGLEADMWSIGVIAYILLCGHRPFYARTETGVFRAIVKSEPKFHEDPWSSLSADANDFVKRLLQKDYRKRMTACQALYHPWIRNYREVDIPLDLIIYRHVKAFVCSSSLRKEALRALVKTLDDTQLSYLRQQFELLGPNTNGFVSVQNFKTALLKYWTEAMKESRVLDFVNWMSSLLLRMFDFEEFAAASVNVHQLELMDSWEHHAQSAYELFEKGGNRTIKIEELALELGLDASISPDLLLHDWVRHSDGKLSFLGFVGLLHGRSSGLPRRVH